MRWAPSTAGGGWRDPRIPSLGGRAGPGGAMGSTFPPSNRWGSVGKLPRPRGALGPFTNFLAGCQSDKGRLATVAFSILGVVGSVGDFGGSEHQKNRPGRPGAERWGPAALWVPPGVAVVQGGGFSLFLGSEHPVLSGSPVLRSASPVGAGVRTLGPQVCLERAGGHCPMLGAPRPEQPRSRGWPGVGSAEDGPRLVRADRSAGPGQTLLLGTRLPAGRWSGLGAGSLCSQP